VTPTQTFTAAILTAVLTSSAWPVFGPRITAWKNRKRNAELKRHERERDQWMRESKEAYRRVQGECKDCYEQLAALRKRHEEEIREIKRELADVKEALLNRIEALDEILPYITSLPDEKVRELRSANRAHRTAVFRTFR
jgi:hypothetical protein